MFVEYSYIFCSFCRIGFTCRCIHSCLFGIPHLPGGQAQYVRIPKAGGTLFNMSSLQSSHSSDPARDFSKVSDSSLLLLADILPTGVFAAMQALQHPKIAPILSGKAYPYGGFVPGGALGQAQASTALQDGDKVLTIGVVGLGPVGVVSPPLSSSRPKYGLTTSLQCATVSLLDILAGLGASQGLQYQVIAIDPIESRRTKMEAVYKAIDVSGKGSGQFTVASIEEGKKLASEWTNGAGCNAVLEVCLIQDRFVGWC